MKVGNNVTFDMSSTLKRLGFNELKVYMNLSVYNIRKRGSAERTRFVIQNQSGYKTVQEFWNDLAYRLFLDDYDKRTLRYIGDLGINSLNHGIILVSKDDGSDEI